ncbi:hypothetical protein [Arthrobacter sp. AD-310]
MNNTPVAAPSLALDPEKPATQPFRAGILRATGVAAAVVLISFLAWFRLPEVSRGTLWAEDAAVFLAETMSIGPWQSIIDPYAGYLHTIPRTISGIAYTIGPIGAYASLVSFLSCVVVASISVGTYFLSGQLFQHRSYRLMVALIPVLLPVGPLEVLGNAANLHWYVLWLFPWLLVYKPRTWAGQAGLFVATLAAATTEIIVGMFLPLALWTALRKRNYAAPAALVVGIGFQFLATIADPRYAETPRLDSMQPLSVIYGFFLQAVGSIWETNPRAMALDIVTFGAFAVAVPSAVVLGLLAYVLLAGQLQWKVAAAYAFAAAAICWGAATVLNPSPEFDFASFTKEDWLSSFTFFRYAAAPAMFLLALVPIACAVAEQRGVIARNRARYLAPVVMAVFLSTSYFQATPARQTGPEWTAGIQAATEKCSADPALVEAVVPVTPSPWQVAVPCRLLPDR